MSDATRRATERDAAGGDPQAAARLLVERVRAGDLAADRLELAAHLGEPAACAALGVTVGEQLEAWVDGLLRWRGEAALRVELAALEQLAAIRRVERPGDGRLERACEVLRRRFEAGDVDDEATGGAMLDALQPENETEHGVDEFIEAAAAAAADAACGGAGRTRLLRLLRLASAEFDRARERPVARSTPARLEPLFLAALRDDVVPWALGRSP